MSSEASREAQERTTGSSDDGPIRRASIVHHVPTKHGAKPDHSAMKVRQLSESLQQDYHASHQSLSSSGSYEHVRFDKVDVIEFPETVGMDVVPTSGPPVALSMDEVGHCLETVDEYEAELAEKKHRLVLKMSKAERERKLREEGIQSEEFRIVEHDADEVRKSRQENRSESSTGSGFRVMDIKGVLGMGRIKKKEKGVRRRLNPFR